MSVPAYPSRLKAKHRPGCDRLSLDPRRARGVLLVIVGMSISAQFARGSNWFPAGYFLTNQTSVTHNSNHSLRHFRVSFLDTAWKIFPPKAARFSLTFAPVIATGSATRRHANERSTCKHSFT